MLEAKTLHHLDVFWVSVIEIICHITCVSVIYCSWDSYIVVPDTRALTIDIPGSFNLVSSGGATPSEFSRERSLGAGCEVRSFVDNSGIRHSIRYFMTFESFKDSSPFSVNSVNELVIDSVSLHFVSNWSDESSKHADNCSNLRVPGDDWCNGFTINVH